MRFIKSFIGGIFTLILFLVSAFLVMIGLLVIDPPTHAFIMHRVMAVGPEIVVVAGVVVFITSLIVRLYSRGESGSSGTYIFEGSKGTIEISLRALEDYLAKHFAGKPIAHTVRTRVGASRDRKKIRVRASISIWSEQNLKVAGETVQREITQCLRDGLGLDNVENIHVSVDRIIASKSASPLAARISSTGLGKGVVYDHDPELGDIAGSRKTEDKTKEDSQEQA